MQSQIAPTPSKAPATASPAMSPPRTASGGRFLVSLPRDWPALPAFRRGSGASVDPAQMLLRLGAAIGLVPLRPLAVPAAGAAFLVELPAGQPSAGADAAGNDRQAG